MGKQQSDAALHGIARAVSAQLREGLLGKAEGSAPAPCNHPAQTAPANNALSSRQESESPGQSMDQNLGRGLIPNGFFLVLGNRPLQSLFRYVEALVFSPV